MAWWSFDLALARTQVLMIDSFEGTSFEKRVSLRFRGAVSLAFLEDSGFFEGVLVAPRRLLVNVMGQGFGRWRHAFLYLHWWCDVRKKSSVRNVLSNRTLFVFGSNRIPALGTAGFESSTSFCQKIQTSFFSRQKWSQRFWARLGLSKATAWQASVGRNTKRWQKSSGCVGTELNPGGFPQKSGFKGGGLFPKIRWSESGSESARPKGTGASQKTEQPKGRRWKSISKRVKIQKTIPAPSKGCLLVVLMSSEPLLRVSPLLHVSCPACRELSASSARFRTEIHSKPGGFWHVFLDVFLWFFSRKKKVGLVFPGIFKKKAKLLGICVKVRRHLQRKATFGGVCRLGSELVTGFEERIRRQTLTILLSLFSIFVVCWKQGLPRTC